MNQLFKELEPIDKHEGALIKNLIRLPRRAEHEYENEDDCQESITKTSLTGTVCQGQLLLTDDFNTKVSEAIWVRETRFPGEPDYPFNVYMEDNLSVSGGSLVITPTTLESKYGENFVMSDLDLGQRCTGDALKMECRRTASGPLIIPPAITGKITTKNSFSFKYGRIEVAAQMPKGDWLIPEIQLEPLNNFYGSSNYASGILRVAYIKRNEGQLYGGPIMTPGEPNRSRYLGKRVVNDDWYNSYHNYTLIWTEENIKVYVDGEIFNEIAPDRFGFNFEGAVPAALNWQRGKKIAPFDQMFYVSLGLSVGGIHDFEDGPNKPWKNTSPKAMYKFWSNRDKWLPSWNSENSSLKIASIKVYAL